MPLPILGMLLPILGMLVSVLGMLLPILGMLVSVLGMLLPIQGMLVMHIPAPHAEKKSCHHCYYMPMVMNERNVCIVVITNTI